jgi:hypothetical protein
MFLNRIKYILSTLIFLAIALYCTAASIPDSLDFTPDDMEVDKIGNYYLIEKSGEIRKYSADKVFLYSFRNFSNGNIASADLTNPHKILVFYKDFQFIQILDNTLSPISTINLNKSQFYSAIASSNDGNIWLYNSLQNRLEKISYEGSEIDELPPFGLPFPGQISNSKMFERDNRIYIFDDQVGIMIFDNLDFSKRILSEFSVSKPEILKNTILYYDTGSKQLISLNILSGEKNIIEDLKTSTPDIALIKNNKTYILRNNTLNIK